MAALKEDRSYGLSCGRVSDGSKVSVFHVKLTDSALRAFESYRASQAGLAGAARVHFESPLVCSVQHPSCHQWTACLALAWVPAWEEAEKIQQDCSLSVCSSIHPVSISWAWVSHHGLPGVERPAPRSGGRASLT
uniref:Uncharacterized protein n=1 Tax=Ovis aries TaxID=9940 RepID=A0AC11DWR1_SHEEP